jgi:hypothetical protein
MTQHRPQWQRSRARRAPQERGPRTQEELQAASEHLLYEINMVRGTSAELSKTSEDRRTGTIWNALLESFVLHSRVLLCVFYPDASPHADDVLALDFFRESQPWRPPSLPSTLSKVRVRANKHLAHLTYTRGVVPADKVWNFVEISTALEGVVRAFLAAVQPRYLSGAWAAEYR